MIQMMTMIFLSCNINRFTNISIRYRGLYDLPSSICRLNPTSVFQLDLNTKNPSHHELAKSFPKMNSEFGFVFGPKPPNTQQEPDKKIGIFMGR